MCYGKIVRNSNSRVEQSLMSRITACLRGQWDHPSLIFRTDKSFCALRGGIPNKIMLTVSTLPIFLVPPKFWAGYAVGFIERLLRAAQKVLGSRMRLSKKWF